MKEIQLGLVVTLGTLVTAPTAQAIENPDPVPPSEPIAQTTSTLSQTSSPSIAQSQPTAPETIAPEPIQSSIALDPAQLEEVPQASTEKQSIAIVPTPDSITTEISTETLTDKSLNSPSSNTKSILKGEIEQKTESNSSNLNIETLIHPVNNNNITNTNPVTKPSTPAIGIKTFNPSNPETNPIQLQPIAPSLASIQPQYSQSHTPDPIANASVQPAAEPPIETPLTPSIAPAMQPPIESESELQILKQKQDGLQQEVDLLRKRINQGIQKPITMPHPDLPDGLQIYSEALFFTPRTDVLLDFARTTPGANPTIGATLATLDYRGSTGWRVGARYRFAKSPWEVGASITRLGSDSAVTLNAPIGGTLSATQFGPTGLPATQAIGSSKFDYTVTDLEGGYHIPLNSKVDLKLFGGLRIANIGQSTAAQYFGGGFGAAGGTIATVNDFRGLGPFVGLEARMALGSGFSVYGRGSGALLFGDQDSSATQALGGTTIADYNVRRKQTVPMVDLAIGLDWATKIGDAGKFMAGVGYGYQHWFNVSRSIRPDGVGGFNENRGDLSMQGFFAKVGLSWTF